LSIIQGLHGKQPKVEKIDARDNRRKRKKGTSFSQIKGSTKKDKGRSREVHIKK